MIDGVVVKQLTRHVDERGYLMEILRRRRSLMDNTVPCDPASL